MNRHASNLDMDRFRKIYAHIECEANEGERDNARRLAEAMAAKAGIAFDDAVARIKVQDEPKTSQRKSTRDWTEYVREEARKAREERLRRKAQQKAEVLTRYRTIFDVFEPTERERVLRKAVSPFSTFVPYQTPACGRAHYTVKMDRCRGDVKTWKLTRFAKMTS